MMLLAYVWVSLGVVVVLEGVVLYLAWRLWKSEHDRHTDH